MDNYSPLIMAIHTHWLRNTIECYYSGKGLHRISNIPRKKRVRVHVNPCELKPHKHSHN